MKIYLSGPITGTNDYMVRFSKAEHDLYKEFEGCAVVNPAKVNAQLPDDTTYEQYMKMCFVMLDMCDAIYMMHGWQKSAGANREYGYALASDKVIMEESHG